MPWTVSRKASLQGMNLAPSFSIARAFDSRAFSGRFAGAFVLLSLVLAHYHSPYWLCFTAFVGLNLFQSSFTNFCPLEMILKKIGVGRDAGGCCATKQIST